MPRGSSARRSALTGGASSAASTPSSSSATARFWTTTFQWRSTASAGNGSCAQQHPLDDRARRRHRRIVERPRREHRRESGRGQQAVALAQRHVEAAREPQHHLAARRRAAGLEAAEMARRDVGGERELELAEAAAHPPVAELRADRGGGSGGHRDKITRRSPAAMTCDVMAPLIARPRGRGTARSARRRGARTIRW
jgi:hypothetical protein